MSAIIAPTSTAIAEPFLLQNQFDVVGQMGVVQDEDWDSIVAALSCEGNTVIETDDGPFMIVTKFSPEMLEGINDEKT